MTRIACPQPETLSAYVVGDLPEPSLSEVAAHLEVCTRCEAHVSQCDNVSDAFIADLRRLKTMDRGTAFDDSTSPASMLAARSSPPAEAWGEFRIVREIGRGGMGVVYEAYQGSLNRHVALKILPDRGDLARFRREAKAAGRLHHTNIVPVFGVGEHEGRAYYAMQYIAGRAFDRVLKERTQAGAPPFGDRDVARFGEQVAAALAYAHAQGVIHRDIKPSNLLLDSQGTVWVTDFGLAHDARDAVTLTHTGDFLGSLRYVAPERLNGRGDARADLYGLGATLYELVCGRPAYADEDRAVLVHRVLNSEPPPLRKYAPHVSRDLETIVLKAMARDPEERYETAAELAEDLRRFREDRPILARRISAWERAVRWARRNKVVAGLAAALVIAFLAGFTGVTLEWRRANAEAVRANLKASSEAEARTAEAAARASERELRIRAQLEIATRDFDKGLDFAHRGDVDYGLLWMAKALVEAPDERPDFSHLVRSNLAGWEDQVLGRRAVLKHRHRQTDLAAFRPDGRAIVTTGDDFSLMFRDLATGRRLGPPLRHVARVRSYAFSRDGIRMATGCQDGSIRVWDAATGEQIAPTLSTRGDSDPPAAVLGVELSADGRLLLSRANSQNILWDVQSRRRLELPNEAGAAIPAWFFPDGRRVLLVNSEAEMAGIWDTATGSIAPPTIRGDRFALGGFLADEWLIGTSADGRTARLWDVCTGRAIATLPRAASTLESATLSPDGRLLFACYRDTTALLWDVANDRPCRGDLPDRGFRPGGAFSPDGRLLVAVGQDFAARIHDVATGRQVGSALRHEKTVRSASFSPDGRLILTMGDDGIGILWEIGRGDLGQRFDASERDARPPSQPRAKVNRASNGLWHPTFSRDGSRIAMIDGPIVRVVDTATGQPVGRPIVKRWPVDGPIAISADGRRVAVSSHDRGFSDGGSTYTTCQVFDCATGRAVSPLLPHANWVSTMAFSPDGSALATGDYSGEVHLWNVDTGSMIGKPLRAGSIVWTLAFRPDGERLASGTTEPDGQAALWDWRSGRRRGDPVRMGGRIRTLAFSPDGATLAASNLGDSISLIDTGTARVRAVVHHEGMLASVTFSPDGRQILTNVDGAVGDESRLWFVASGLPASPVVRQGNKSTISAAFNPAGTVWATSQEDGTLRSWDVATARPIGAPATVRNGRPSIVFAQDGRSLIAIDRRGNALAWPISRPATGTVEAVARRIQHRTGMEFDSGGAAAFLSPEDWDQLRARPGDPLWKVLTLPSRGEPSPSDAKNQAHPPEARAGDPEQGAAEERAWHEANARDAEALGDSFGARWHLDRLIAVHPREGQLYARRARLALWAGNAADCRQDIAEALRLGPREVILDWLEHCAADFSSDGRSGDALCILDQVIAARPDDWLAYALRSSVMEALGRTDDRDADIRRAIERGPDLPFLLRIADERSHAGLWSAAVPLFDRAIAMGTVPYEVWMQAATAHLEIGDDDGYRRVCRVMRDRHPASIFERDVAAMLIGVATLAPGGFGDDGKVLRWIETLQSTEGSLPKELRRDSMRLLATSHYRAGRHQAALTRLQEAIAQGGAAIRPEEAILLALVQSRSGAPDQARALLALARTDEPSGPSAEEWWAMRGRRLLRHEAERLILDPGFPADPFAP